ncbi:pyridoxamine 5'-phosphate oxidase [Melghirimyces profundicolus]|uniref:Pyridoxamine 5'-phosphate oxidase n=1 Tax=Melghirimyces profundicolus TaxID=1242148 RepID=A0A2T6C9I7_9BACL|nr:pyridoxamine 5'-phosphate oxidase family protein [Melghirimyces profundicolus]PTX64984.1 pyridoxamine 5'-phosphate oxidase [Melghirimyces profundicolus]
MKIIRDRKRSFDLDQFLTRPLFAHLSTVCEEGPRDSPVWFHWEEGFLWIIGVPSTDSFPDRIRRDPRCAVGIVDFHRESGRVLHAGFRGRATVEPFDQGIATRLLSRYLGPDEGNWDPRFRDLDDSNVLIRVQPETVVVRDQSYVPAPPVKNR